MQDGNGGHCFGKLEIEILASQLEITVKSRLTFWRHRLTGLANAPKESQPHDHGKYWAIYGQAEGETIMSDWELVEPARESKPGKVRHVRAYPLRPGMAKLYNEGDIHSPRRDGPTRLIRIEGRNMEGQPRGTFEQV